MALFLYPSVSSIIGKYLLFFKKILLFFIDGFLSNQYDLVRGLIEVNNLIRQVKRTDS